jgi:P-type Cu+ transporter
MSKRTAPGGAPALAVGSGGPEGGFSGVRELELSVGGMTCAACAARVEARLNKLAGVSATVNFATERARIAAAAEVPASALVAAVEGAGYTAELTSAAGLVAGGGGEAARVRYLGRRLVPAVVLFVPLSDLSVLLSLFPSYRFAGWQWVLVALAAWWRLAPAAPAT